MRRRSAALACAACLCAVLPACSPGPPSAPAGPPAASAGPANPSGPESPDASAPTPGSPTTVTATSNAAELAQRASHSAATLRSAHLTITSAVGGTRTTVTGQIAYHPVRMDLTVAVRGMRIREVLVGQTLYLKAPGAGTPGKPWRSLSLRRLAAFSGLDLRSLINSANADPTVQLLNRAADLRLVGVETVGGVRTRHLTGTVDLDAVFAAMPASERATATTLQDMVDQLGVTDDQIDVWVNDDELPVKVVQSYLSSLGPGRSTMYLSRLNARTSISAPPRSQVAPFPG